MSRSAEKLIDQIKKDISEGRLNPGDQLEEAILSQQFKVSRTPVREAIRSLVHAGILETRARKGAFVRRLTAKELLDLFELAAELEAMASKLAANCLTADGMQALKNALFGCEEAASGLDVERYGEANLNFHRTIHNASANIWLVQQLKQIELHINPYRTMPYGVPSRIGKSMNENAAISQAILAGHGAEARDQMYDHMMLQGKRIPSLLQALETHQNDH